MQTVSMHLQKRSRKFHTLPFRLSSLGAPAATAKNESAKLQFCVNCNRSNEGHSKM